jgi:hypothetical protein
MEQGELNALLPTPTLQDLISRYRRTAPTALTATKPLGSFTSLSITEPKPKNHPKGNRSTCVCGLHQSVLQCFTLNPEAEGRCKEFEPSAKALSQLVKAFRNTDTLKKVKKAYKDAGIRWTFDVEKAKPELAKLNHCSTDGSWTLGQTFTSATRQDRIGSRLAFLPLKILFPQCTVVEMFLLILIVP